MSGLFFSTHKESVPSAGSLRALRAMHRAQLSQVTENCADTEKNTVEQYMSTPENSAQKWNWELVFGVGCGAKNHQLGRYIT